MRSTSAATALPLMNITCPRQSTSFLYAYFSFSAYDRVVMPSPGVSLFVSLYARVSGFFCCFDSCAHHASPAAASATRRTEHCQPVASRCTTGITQQIACAAERRGTGSSWGHGGEVAARASSSAFVLSYALCCLCDAGVVLLQTDGDDPLEQIVRLAHQQLSTARDDVGRLRYARGWRCCQ